MEQVGKEQAANHKRKAISARLTEVAKQRFMLDPFELDDGGNNQSQIFHELVKEYCIKHMSTMRDKGTIRGDF